VQQLHQLIAQTRLARSRNSIEHRSTHENLNRDESAGRVHAAPLNARSACGLFRFHTTTNDPSECRRAAAACRAIQIGT